jgi:hypothetical protein
VNGRSRSLAAETRNMSIHPKAEYQILIDNASRYILDHAAGAGMTIESPVWDRGAPYVSGTAHHVRLVMGDAEDELEIPHEWLPIESEGHNRFRTEVEAALARLKVKARAAARG